jgi:formylglycine-generating enzyme required for sulfatase activity
MGSTHRADESPHRKRISRTFAIAAKAVTVEQYRKFAAGYGVGDIEGLARTTDSPMIRMSWFDAVAYCNWLSKQEGLPESEWCYEPLLDSKGLSAPEYKGGMKLARNYLKRSGYRLPQEAEWEYACGAGAVTRRYYGETEDLLEKYAWYLKNSQERTWPVGTLKPNDLGLFDMYGNVWNWCQEKYKNYPQEQPERIYEDAEDTLIINDQESRMLRGGSYPYPGLFLRSAYRFWYVPTFRPVNDGFRVARTFTP